eukprot:COSAG01_NODE_22400_length_857_cov_1.328496_1_plen_43_part_10
MSKRIAILGQVRIPVGVRVTRRWQGGWCCIAHLQYIDDAHVVL